MNSNIIHNSFVISFASKFLLGGKVTKYVFPISVGHENNVDELKFMW